jgi:hypothetical protein
LLNWCGFVTGGKKKKKHTTGCGLKPARSV